MKFEKVRYATEAVGMLAIVASLIFVGLQMRQTHEIALVTLYQMRSDAARELAAAQLDSDILLDLDSKLAEGGELSSYENFLRSLPHFIFFNHFENSHYLYQRGFLSEEHWESDLSAIRAMVQTDSNVLEYWNQQKTIFRPSFVQEIDTSGAL